MEFFSFAALQTLNQQQALQVQQKLGLKKFSAQSLSLPQKAGDDLKVIVIKDGEQKTLRLLRKSLRAKNFRVRVQLADGTLAEVAPPEPLTYRGTIDEDFGSIVVASLLPSGFTASIHTADKKTWHVQPMRDADKNSSRDLHIVYDAAELEEHPGVCGADDQLNRTLEPEQNELIKNAGGGSCTKLCQLAFDADYEYFQLNGADVSNVIADIENITNGMESIYAHDTMISYEITDVIVRTIADDPYTESGASELLQQFRSEWNSNHTGVQRDIAHLMTGREIDSNTIGIAYKGVICSRSYGYGLSQSLYTSNMNRRIALTAHEIGHNWNASHSNDEDDAGIMCSSLGGCGGNISSFAQASIESILGHRDSRSCLTDGTGATNPVQPIVLDDNAGEVEGSGPFAIDVLANDRDGNCDVLSIPDFNAASVSGGSITKGTGAQGQDILLYAPPVNFSGIDSFFYLVTDPTGMGGWAMVTITVTGAPVVSEETLRNYLLGVEPYPAAAETSMDVNGDSSFSFSDLLSLVNKEAKN